MLARFVAMFQSAASPVRDPLPLARQAKAPPKQVPAAQEPRSVPPPQFKASQLRGHQTPAQGSRADSPPSQEQQGASGPPKHLEPLHEKVQRVCDAWKLDTKQPSLRPMDFHAGALEGEPVLKENYGVASKSVYEFQANFKERQKYLFTALWHYPGHRPGPSGIAHTFAARAYDSLIRMRNPSPDRRTEELRPVTAAHRVVALEMREGVQLGVAMKRPPGEAAAVVAQRRPDVFEDPQVMRRIVYMQLLDHLTGQNRNPDNFLVDETTGQVTMIDNQGSFRHDRHKANTVGLGFPPVVHEEDAEAILCVNASDLDTLGLTSPAEVEAAKARLDDLKNWLSLKAEVIPSREWTKTMNRHTENWKNGKTPPFTAGNSYIGKLRFPKEEPSRIRRDFY